MEPILLTPGPLTTSKRTKEAMLRDWGSRDAAFIEITKNIRNKLVALIHGGDDYTCVPIQGSGTFAIESMIGGLTNEKSKILLLINGAYGHRMKKICDYLKREYIIYETDEDKPPDVNTVEEKIKNYQNITHILAVHCETTSGILNPIEKISRHAKQKNIKIYIDAMSSFGSLPIDLRNYPYDAIAASSNKCLEGVPGVGFVIVKKNILNESNNNSHSLSLDLYDQWKAIESNGQWRFTPPTHILAALHEALLQLEEEGGIKKRFQRYSNNCKIIIEGMARLGFKNFLPNNLQAPIIITFFKPQSKNYNFDRFYQLLAEKNYLIYPGKITNAETFRIGCIGSLNKKEVEGALEAIKEVVKEMNIF